MSFTFKQFIVGDKRSAMKVGTDGVLLGAWCCTPVGLRVWDVGAGCGILSLIMCQRGAELVEGFEIHNGASMDFIENISKSLWSDKISLHCGDFNTTYQNAVSKPDIIISNPPFFNEALHSPLAARSQARHEDTLNFTSLFKIASSILPMNGILCTIAPAQRFDELEFEAQMNHLNLCRASYVRPIESKACNRILMEFSPCIARKPVIDEIVIRISPDTFTKKYKELTSEFYLNF